MSDLKDLLSKTFYTKQGSSKILVYFAPNSTAQVMMGQYAVKHFSNFDSALLWHKIEKFFLNKYGFCLSSIIEQNPYEIPFKFDVLQQMWNMYECSDIVVEKYLQFKHSKGMLFHPIIMTLVTIVIQKILFEVFLEFNNLTRSQVVFIGCSIGEISAFTATLANHNDVIMWLDNFFYRTIYIDISFNLQYPNLCVKRVVVYCTSVHQNLTHEYLQNLILELEQYVGQLLSSIVVLIKDYVMAVCGESNMIQYLINCCNCINQLDSLDEYSIKDIIQQGVQVKNPSPSCKGVVSVVGDFPIHTKLLRYSENWLIAWYSKCLSQIHVDWSLLQSNYVSSIPYHEYNSDYASYEQYFVKRMATVTFNQVDVATSIPKAIDLYNIETFVEISSRPQLCKFYKALVKYNVLEFIFIPYKLFNN